MTTFSRSELGPANSLISPVGFHVRGASVTVPAVSSTVDRKFLADLAIRIRRKAPPTIRPASAPCTPATARDDAP
jgi:hypothetical protein